MGEAARRGSVVAIDGPAGSGKSTLATRLAVALGLAYVNTGLMYRALTLRALRAGVDPADGSGLARLMRGMRFDLDSRVMPASLRIDGEAPSPDLTGLEVEANVSEVSRHHEVRSLMRVEQRRLGEAGAVMEGRDIGSVIFPDAEVKVFLMAAPDERAARRILEREPGRGGGARADGVAESLEERDSRDARVNPFVPAEDAVAVDTTGKRPEEVFEEVLRLVRTKLETEP